MKDIKFWTAVAGLATAGFVAWYWYNKAREEQAKRIQIENGR